MGSGISFKNHDLMFLLFHDNTLELLWSRDTLVITQEFKVPIKMTQL